VRSPSFVEASSLCCPSCGGPSAYWLDFEVEEGLYPEGAPVFRVCAPHQRPDGFIELDISCFDERVALVPWADIDEGIKSPDHDICSAADLDQMVVSA